MQFSLKVYVLTNCGICIYKLTVVCKLHCICLWKFWDSPGANQSTNQFFQQGIICSQSDFSLLFSQPQEHTQRAPLSGSAANVSWLIHFGECFQANVWQITRLDVQSIVQFFQYMKFWYYFKMLFATLSMGGYMYTIIWLLGMIR